MNKEDLLYLIDSGTIFDCDNSDYREAEEEFVPGLDYIKDKRIIGIDLIIFSMPTNQVILWCQNNNSRLRSRFTIDAPQLNLLRRMWEMSRDSHKHIKRFILANKPKQDDSERGWMMSILLGSRDE